MYKVATMMSLAALAVGQAQAKEVTVTVPATAMPWNPGVNGKKSFGRRDGGRPVMIAGQHLFEGAKVRFVASGETTTIPGGIAIGPDGQADFVADDAIGNSGLVFPAHYVDQATRPVKLNALIGAFIDADGRVVGAPFLIGRGATVRVPAGAMGLSLGINDDIYADNGGSLSVNVDIPEASVTVEEKEGQ
ncbi:hypothetical protein [Sphingobium sp.]|uniref:hypothetical protein n=1 Tax=Sphingobium sp. TaxID=1912891 RepID=UPI0026325A89|nr:hypothetical protein [Sphingobium sp.]